MKNILKISVLALFVSGILVSCSSDDNSNSSGQAGVTFKVDGTSVTASELDAVLYTNAVAGGRYIDIIGYQGENQIIEFHFPAATGSYPAQQSFDMTTSWLTYLTNGGLDYPGDYFNSTSGTINVTTCDTINNKIVATFNFTGSNETVTKSITNGSLSLNAITHN